MSVPIKILIVDDEENMRVTLTDIFESLGYEINTAEDGYQAIDICKSKDFDILLMDFKMPGLNGVETYDEIRKILPTVKVIFITAYFDEKILKEVDSEGIAAICNKPIDIPRLIENIKVVVGGS